MLGHIIKFSADVRRLDSTIKLKNCQYYSSLLLLRVQEYCFLWCYVICKNIISSLKRYPLSQTTEMFKQTFSSLKYKHVVKWDSASHYLIIIHIGSGRNWYLKWNIEELSCTHRHQINSHYTSAKVVRVEKWHYTTGQATTCSTRLPRSPRQDEDLNVCVIMPWTEASIHRPHSWWEGGVWGHWGSLYWVASMMVPNG